MAIGPTVNTVTVTVTVTAAKLVASPTDPANETLVSAPSGNTNTVFVGGSDVDTSDGFPLVPGASVKLDTDPAHAWAVVASGTETVNVIYQ